MEGTIIKLAASAVASVVCLVLYFASKSKSKTQPENKKNSKTSKLFFILMIIASWFFVASIFGVFIKSKGISLEFEMFSERTTLFGISFAKTSLTMSCIAGIVLVLGVVFRFAVVPRFSEDKPGGFQHAMETLVDFFESYTSSKVEGNTGWLSSYLMALSVLMLGCAAVELFSFRPPTSDILVTFSMGLVTFFLINWYGIKRKKISGRLKSLASPSPVIFPMRVISDIAVPVSLACRLFGNMLGGMIVMDLLKGAAGGYALGLAPLAGLYFNLFHPVIQIYIFITLSLTFINEATE